jgi:hypothetical protein
MGSRSIWLRWLAVPIIGMGLGLASLALEHAPAPVSPVSALGGPWLVVAFVAGSLFPRPMQGLVSGIATLIMAMGGYYLAKLAVGSPLNPPEYDDPMFWLATGVVGGSLFGVGGALWASGSFRVRVAMAAMLSGTVLAEVWLARGVWPRLAGIVLVVALLGVLLRGVAERATALALTIAGAGAIRLLAEVALPVLLRFR